MSEQQVMVNVEYADMLERKVKDLQSRLGEAEERLKYIEDEFYSPAHVARLNETIKEQASRLGDAEMRVREIVAWLDVIESKYDPALRRMLGGDWPTYWLSEVRATISGCGVETSTLKSDPVGWLGSNGHGPIVRPHPFKYLEAGDPNYCAKCGESRGASVHAVTTPPE